MTRLSFRLLVPQLSFQDGIIVTAREQVIVDSTAQVIHSSANVLDAGEKVDGFGEGIELMVQSSVDKSDLSARQSNQNQLKSSSVEISHTDDEVRTVKRTTAVEENLAQQRYDVLTDELLPLKTFSMDRVHTDGSDVNVMQLEPVSDHIVRIDYKQHDDTTGNMCNIGSGQKNKGFIPKMLDEIWALRGLKYIGSRRTTDEPIPHEVRKELKKRTKNSLKHDEFGQYPTGNPEGLDDARIDIGFKGVPEYDPTDSLVVDYSEGESLEEGGESLEEASEDRYGDSIGMSTSHGTDIDDPFFHNLVYGIMLPNCVAEHYLAPREDPSDEYWYFVIFTFMLSTLVFLTANLGLFWFIVWKFRRRIRSLQYVVQSSQWNACTTAWNASCLSSIFMFIPMDNNKFGATKNNDYSKRNFIKHGNSILMISGYMILPFMISLGWWEHQNFSSYGSELHAKDITILSVFQESYNHPDHEAWLKHSKYDSFLIDCSNLEYGLFIPNGESKNWTNHGIKNNGINKTRANNGIKNNEASNVTNNADINKTRANNGIKNNEASNGIKSNGANNGINNADINKTRANNGIKSNGANFPSVWTLYPLAAWAMDNLHKTDAFYYADPTIRPLHSIISTPAIGLHNYIHHHVNYIHHHVKRQLKIESTWAEDFPIPLESFRKNREVIIHIDRQGGLLMRNTPVLREILDEGHIFCKKGFYKNRIQHPYVSLVAFAIGRNKFDENDWDIDNVAWDIAVDKVARYHNDGQENDHGMIHGQWELFQQSHPHVIVEKNIRLPRIVEGWC